MKKQSPARDAALAAMLMALSVAIGFICKTYLTFGAVRVTFENLPVLIAGIAFGPVVGALVGIGSDVVSAVFSGFAVNPIITVGAAAIGACAGLLRLYFFKSNKYVPFLFTALISHAVGSMAIKSVGLYTLGFSLPMLWPRIPLYIGIAIAESYIIYILSKNKFVAKTFFGGKA
ncbi:MAG: folate family ECF transporter S component [Clostridia bacterium]|nr:folate family ECF transporter S component [Clostridia bacterium]